MNIANRFGSAILAILCLLAAAGLAPAHAASTHKSREKKPVLVVPAGNPQLVTISKIGVRAPVESLNLNLKVNRDAPRKWSDVAWYNLSPRPGAAGRASIFGHLDSYCCPAVFWKLKALRPGDNVQVYYKTGKPITFRVQWGTSFTNKKLPLKFIFGRTTERGLVLLTCFGAFNKVSGYTGKWMVYARAVLPNGKLG